MKDEAILSVGKELGSKRDEKLHALKYKIATMISNKPDLIEELGVSQSTIYVWRSRYKKEEGNLNKALEN